MIKRILRYYDVQTQRIPDRAIKVLANGLNNMSKHPANWFNTTLLFLKDGARLDQRNSAMSVVAGLMGADSLLASSGAVISQYLKFHNKTRPAETELFLPGGYLF